MSGARAGAGLGVLSVGGYGGTVKVKVWGLGCVEFREQCLGSSELSEQEAGREFGGTRMQGKPL